MFRTLPFDSMPALNENAKEFISLSVWSLYRKQGKLLLIIPGGCQCCHGGRPSKYFFLEEDGSFKEEASEEFYRSPEGNDSLEIIKFELPERMTSKYLKISLKN